MNGYLLGAVCVGLYLSFGSWLGWYAMRDAFARCRRAGAPVREARVDASQTFGLFLLFWPVLSVVKAAVGLHTSLMDRAEKASWTTSERVAQLEKELGRMKRHSGEQP